MKKPIIGVTLDFVTEGSFSARPHYAIRESYFNMVRLAGGIPIGIPFQVDLIDDYLQIIDGVIIPGGDFALDANWYVAGDGPAYPPSKRLAFDVEIINKAITANKPLLGICAGMQILAGIYGCKLSSNIQAHSKTGASHRGTDPYKIAHNVDVVAVSLLAKIIGGTEIGVNSHHSEGVVEASNAVKVCGVSDDGIIEAIEIPDKKFALAVQWHPEFFLDNHNPNFQIARALINAAL
jgi:putative glutamine amidotransferase